MTYCQLQCHAKAYEYKIAESLNPADGLNGLDQYILVVHQRVGKYVDIC